MSLQVHSSSAECARAVQTLKRLDKSESAIKNFFWFWVSNICE